MPINIKYLILIVLTLKLSSWKVKAETLIHASPWYNTGLVSDTLPDIDTSFNPDTAGGWGYQSSFLQIQGDSVLFEPVFTRIAPTINDWSQYTLVGKIPTSYFPTERQIIEYKQPSRTWSIILIPDGRCFLALREGSNPSDNPSVVQFQIRYKK